MPKTIDNDLGATDYTFGFDTAVNIAMEAIDRLHTTAESHQRVLIVEVMGRHAGWIALHAGVAGGANVILIPEVQFDLDRGLRVHRAPLRAAVRADRRRRRGGRAGGRVPLTRPGAADAFGHVRLGGIAHWLEGEIEERTGREARATVLGHVQRGGTPTAFDRVLATRFGLAAIDAVDAGEWGKMTALRSTEHRTGPRRGHRRAEDRSRRTSTAVRRSSSVSRALRRLVPAGARRRSRSRPRRSPPAAKAAADVEGPVTVVRQLAADGPAGAEGNDAADGARLALEQAGRRRAASRSSGARRRRGAGWDPVAVGANARAAAQDSSAVAYIGELDSRAHPGVAADHQRRRDRADLAGRRSGRPDPLRGATRTRPTATARRASRLRPGRSRRRSGPRRRPISRSSSG